MEKLLLNGSWQMRKTTYEKWISAQVPGSVYSDLLSNNLMEDPYYGENEKTALKLCEYDYEYKREFILDAEMVSSDKLLLCCDGLDTLCEIYLNGSSLGKTNNMHRSYEFDVKDYVHKGNNVICVRFDSPLQFIAEKKRTSKTWGTEDAISGFELVRKAHCMYGWDWGPQLPDMGIWKDIYICAYDKILLDDVYITQKHTEDAVRLLVDTKHSIISDSCSCNAKNVEVKIKVILTSPDGKVIDECITTKKLNNTVIIDITKPMLWWPNGLGKQHLYEVTVLLIHNDIIKDKKQLKIGLRTLTIRNEKDQWGECFEYNINGVSIFAMGADYIPEDSILSRCNAKRTETLIRDCVNANFNCIRVWGGGFYPFDYFYDLCDQYGLIVWQDFMFACATYEMTEDFSKNIEHEFIDNIRRLRHHASLGLWCGNNEMEWGWVEWGFPKPDKLKADYIKQFEVLIPNILKEYDPNTFYWPASPSSGGSFDDPNSYDRGDVHYWQVWHGQKPFTDYRKYYFRFLSEFGFQSFPSIKTIETFTLPVDRNIFSSVMENHQKNGTANGKILYYLSETFLYPKDFESLIYTSQVLQAEAIKYGVEHFRRNRGRCMGAVYWQLNDCWPVASWASIDYYGRWKLLHYAAKKFFAPILLSACEEGTCVDLHVSNESMMDVNGKVKWMLRTNTSDILSQGENNFESNSLSSLKVVSLDFSESLKSKQQLRSCYLEYQLIVGGEVLSSSTVLFVKPKHFKFIDPQIAFDVNEDEEKFYITLNSKKYAKYVELDLKENDCLFSDNCFDMSANTKYFIDVAKNSLAKSLTLKEFNGSLAVRSIYDIT